MLIKKMLLKKYKRLYLNEITNIEYTPTSRFQLIVGRNGSGKAQPLYSKIKTPEGWTTMGDIKIGDIVSTPDGWHSTVVGVFPQGKRDIVTVKTVTGRKTDCDLYHLWKVYVNDKWILEETKTIRKLIKEGIDVYVPIYENDTETKEKIESITRSGSEIAKCIMIDGVDNLYITDDNIVTHNTSLLNAIFNQPADKNDYDKGGLNQVYLEHKRYEYLITNDFTNSAKYSFKRRPIDSDEEFEELNSSRLVSTQKDLVQDHFNLDSDIIALLLSEVEFTSMPINKRRDWFNKMHVSKLTYLNSLYQSIKTKYRDAVGTVKNIGNKLTIEKNSQITEEEYDEIVKRKAELDIQNRELAKSFSQDLIDNYKPNEINRLLGALNTTCNKVGHHFKNKTINYQDLTISIDESKKYLTKIQTRKEEAINQLSLVKKKFDKMALDKKEYSQYSSTEKLKDNETKCIAELAEIENTINRDYNEFNAFKFNSTYVNADNYQDISDRLIYALPQQDDDLSLKNVRYDALLEERKSLTNQVDHLNFNLDKMLDKKKHFQEHLNANSVKCPYCGGSFNRDYDEGSIESIEIAIKSTVKELNVAKQLLDKCEYTLEQYNIYKERFDRLKPLVEQFDIKEIIPNLVSASTYNSRAMFIGNYFKAYQLKLRERHLRTELKLIQEQIRIRAEKGEDYYQRIETDINIVENELRQYQDTIYQLEDEIKLVSKNLKTKEELVNVILNEIPTLIENVNTTFIEECKYKKHSLLRDMWEKSLNELQIVTKKYNEYNMKANLINGYTTMLEEENKKIKEYSILMDELSPQNGLIAEKATSFINLFISNLNIVIRKIFNYDLIVEPCDLAEGDLTYRFKVTGGNQVRNDISNTSDGQKEVINLAFKLLAYHYCHLDEIPFVNDELGKNFDEFHKQASINYLRDLMVEDKFNQFFLISHHATSYTSLIDAEVVVLDPNNVVLPEKYNTGLIINGK